MTEQPQQHGVGGVDTETIQAGIERLYKADFVGRGWLATWTADIGTLCDDYDRLRARCASLEAVAEAARREEQRHLRDVDSRTREMSAEKQSWYRQAHTAGCDLAGGLALAALDQHATTTQEGNHG